MSNKKEQEEVVETIEKVEETTEQPKEEVKAEKKVEEKKEELKNLSNKFKQLKALIYEYRDKKEREISDLNQNHFKIKNEIETNQKNYERLIDEAADEISSFVDKANLENLS